MIENITKFRILDGALQYLTFNGIWKHLLTIDELTSIRNASSPSGSNVLATTNDVTSASDTLNSTIQGIVDLDTVSAIASTDIDWSGSKYLSKTLAENTELFDTNLPVNPITKEIYLHVTPATYDLTLPTYWRVISGTFDNTVDNLIKAVCLEDTAVKKVDTITLTGTSGTATITLAGGLTKTVTFAAAGTTDLAQTAEDFVTSFAADYLAQKILITNSGADIIFTSQYAGYDFTSPAIANATGDLDGTVANTTANTSPVVWAWIYKEA